MNTVKTCVLVALLIGLQACSAVRATGRAAEGVGEGTGHALSEVGRGAGHAVSETGRALDDATDLD